MTQYEKLGNYFKNKIGQKYSESYLKVISDLKDGCCVPGSVVVEDLIIPVITVKLSVNDLSYFGIRNGPPLDMEQRFRYLENTDCDELLEICLHFVNNNILALDFDPMHSSIRLIINEIIRADLFGFGFYCKEIGQILFSFTAPNFEDLQWLKRNSKRMEFLEENNFGRMLAGSRSHDAAMGIKTKRYFTGIEAGVDCFINRSSRLIPFENIKDYLY